MNCYCGNNISYQQCCGKLIQGKQEAQTPEQLMRSRYSAYVAGEFDYIWRTYSQQHGDIPSIEEIRQHALGTRWLKLTIENSHTLMNNGEVEFRAIYQQNGALCQLHEKSTFIIEQGRWRYLSGEILTDSGPL